MKDIYLIYLIHLKHITINVFEFHNGCRHTFRRIICGEITGFRSISYSRYKKAMMCVKSLKMLR